MGSFSCIGGRKVEALQYFISHGVGCFRVSTE